MGHGGMGRGSQGNRDGKYSLIFGQARQGSPHNLQLKELLNGSQPYLDV